MTEQKKRIIESSNFIKVNSPFKGKFETALITYANPAFLKEFNAVKTVPYKTIQPKQHTQPTRKTEQYRKKPPYLNLLLKTPLTPHEVVVLKKLVMVWWVVVVIFLTSNRT